jgi:hypothetical protein
MSLLLACFVSKAAALHRLRLDFAPPCCSAPQTLIYGRLRYIADCLSSPQLVLRFRTFLGVVGSSAWSCHLCQTPYLGPSAAIHSSVLWCHCSHIVLCYRCKFLHSHGTRGVLHSDFTRATTLTTVHTHTHRHTHTLSKWRSLPHQIWTGFSTERPFLTFRKRLVC